MAGSDIDKLKIHTVVSPLIPKDATIGGVIEEGAIDIYESIISDNDDPEESEETRWLRHERLAHRQLHWLKRPSLWMIVIVAILRSLADYVAPAAGIELLSQAFCKKYGDQCNPAQVQIDLTAMSQIELFAGGIISVLLAGKIGQLSDIYGRKPCLIANIALVVITNVCTTFLLSSQFPIFHRNLIILSDMIKLLGGGEVAARAICYSYVIDVVPEEERTVALSFLTASSAVGLTLAPIMSSLLLEFVFDKQPIYILITSIVVSLILLLFVIFVLPESRSKRLRKKSMSDRAESFSTQDGPQSLNEKGTKFFTDLFSPLKLLYHAVPSSDDENDGKRTWELRSLVLMDVVFNFDAYAVTNALLMYALYVFQWTSIEMNYLLFAFGSTRSILLLFLSPLIHHQLKKRFTPSSSRVDNIDLSLIRMSWVFQFTGYVIEYFSNSTKTILAGSAIEGFSALFAPALRSALIKYTPSESTGEVLGALNILDNMVALVSPQTILWIYSSTVESAPKTFLLVGIGIMAMCGVLVFSVSGKPRSHLAI